MLTEILKKYQDKQPMNFGKATERVYPISAVISMMEEYADAKLNNLIKPGVKRSLLSCKNCNGYYGINIKHQCYKCLQPML